MPAGNPLTARLTVPVKPTFGTMAIWSELLVPSAITKGLVALVVGWVCSVNAAPLMSKNTEVACTFVPSVPMKLIWAGPAVAVEPAVRVKLAAPPTGALADVGLTVTPTGTVLGTMATVPLRVPVGTTEIVTVTLAPPRIKESGVERLLAGVEAREKLEMLSGSARFAVSAPETPEKLIWADPAAAVESARMLKIAP